ncbi:MAG: hypothetical protein C0407_10450, partial [Desulfobacca sp.]|nr:hypothetical protein [Desulfobacca sp.]
MPFFQIIVPPLNHPLLYEVPADFSEGPAVGQRVLVPLKKKLVTGYLWEEVPLPEAGPEIKPVSQILDPRPLFSETLKPFFTWIAHYYLYPLGQVLKTALPPGLAVSSYQKVTITLQGNEALQEGRLPEKTQAILQKLTVKGLAFSCFSGEEKKVLCHLEAQGWIQQDILLKKETARLKREKWVYPGAGFWQEHFLKKDGPLFDLLSTTPGLALKELRIQCPISGQRLTTLSRKGLIE